MSIDKSFYNYFAALDRSAGSDRCYICRRTPADIKLFFGFHEDGVPVDADHYGIEHVDIGQLDVMSYRGVRPVCAVCQLNLDALFLMDEGPVLLRLLRQVKEERDQLWPSGDGEAGEAGE
jgi:hypothetical protein